MCLKQFKPFLSGINKAFWIWSLKACENEAKAKYISDVHLLPNIATNSDAQWLVSLTYVSTQYTQILY